MNGIFAKKTRTGRDQYGISSSYEQRSLELKKNKRPYDMAMKDYLAGNNLLGDRFEWDVELWRAA